MNKDLLTTTILDSLNHGIIIIDKDENIEYINLRLKFWLKWNDIDTDELLQKKDLSFYSAFKKVIKNQKEFDGLVKSFSGKKNLVNDSLDVEVNKGPYKYLNVFTTPIHGKKEGYIGRLWVFEDVTKIKKLDNAKTDFISIASHQLRTPTTIIQGYLSMIEEETEEIIAIKKGADRLSEVIEDLLNISNINTDKVKVKKNKENTIELFNNILEYHSIKAKEKNIVFKKSFDIDNNHKFFTDKKFLKHIINNLLDNAVKYTNEGGEVEVKIFQEGNTLYIQVKDNGIGIPKKEQEKISERFFRAKNVQNTNISGTGIGLYYVYQLVEGLKGNIYFNSEEGKGTEFTIEFPNS